MSRVDRHAFERLAWQTDRMLLDGLVFRLQHYKSDDWTGGEHFMFFKIKRLVDQYERYFQQNREFQSSHVMELGIFDGGSVAFWHELLRPEKHVAVDLLDRNDSTYFQQYVAQRGLSERIRTFWNTNQADKALLRQIVSTELGGKLDLVLDDASHLYGPTLASFEALFPLMSQGGIYIIEDWAWAHWPAFGSPDHIWAKEEPPTKLIFQLIEAAGTSTELIANVNVYRGFTAVERGPLVIENPESFALENHIVRRPEGRATGISALAGKVLGRIAKSSH